MCCLDTHVHLTIFKMHFSGIPTSEFRNQTKGNYHFSRAIISSTYGQPDRLFLNVQTRIIRMLYCFTIIAINIFCLTLNNVPKLFIVIIHEMVVKQNNLKNSVGVIRTTFFSICTKRYRDFSLE